MFRVVLAEMIDPIPSEPTTGTATPAATTGAALSGADGRLKPPGAPKPPAPTERPLSAPAPPPVPVLGPPIDSPPSP